MSSSGSSPLQRPSGNRPLRQSFERRLRYHHFSSPRNRVSGRSGDRFNGRLGLGGVIALVSALDAMVCVDSGFLHAAGAFDVPVVAMFGPTDGKLFTRHRQHATMVSANESFACAPCWRNEDLPCQVTRRVGTSPCVAALKVEAVQAAVAEALLRRVAEARVGARPTSPRIYLRGDRPSPNCKPRVIGSAFDAPFQALADRSAAIRQRGLSPGARQEAGGLAVLACAVAALRGSALGRGWSGA